MSADDIIVSVWMTTYNHELYISQAIEGVLNQKTTFPFELVIGEDCSTDKTRGICFTYKEKYPQIINLILHEKNMGLRTNYNLTLNQCRGKYIAQCDGDDYWTDPFKLQKQVDFLESNKECSMIFTDKDVQAGEIIYRSKNDKDFTDSSFESILLLNMICSVTILVRSEILKNCFTHVINIASERNWLTLDYPLWLEISLNHKVCYISDVTCVYRVVNESGSHPTDRLKAYKWERCLIDIQLYYYQYYKNQNKNIREHFKNKFRERIFHLKKRMILTYGFLAREDFFDILIMNPLFYFYLIYYKCRRIIVPNKA